jgi:hypothetical protein
MHWTTGARLVLAFLQVGYVVSSSLGGRSTLPPLLLPTCNTVP